MNTKQPKKQTQRLLSLITISLGIVLLVMMIVIEDEPGAIPLFLILAGTVWYIVDRNRNKSASN